MAGAANRHLGHVWYSGLGLPLSGNSWPGYPTG